MLQGLKLTIVAASAWLPAHAFRLVVLRLAGAKVAADVVLYHGYQVRHPRGLEIGQDTSVGDRAVLDARGGLVIGQSVNISSEVQLWSAQHDWRSATFEYEERKVIIGDRAWLGPRVIVLPGSVVGEGAVVAAGAVVRGELAPWGLYAGVPARRIADRPRDLGYTLGGPRMKPWFW